MNIPRSRNLRVAQRFVAAGIPVVAAEPLLAVGDLAEFAFPCDMPWLGPGATPLDAWRPGWALAMLTGFGLDVVDVDTKNGADVAREKRILDELGLPLLGEVRTPSGGAHLYVPSCGLSCTSIHSRHIDFRGRNVDGTRGGFVYLPGTQRRKYPGLNYDWLCIPHLKGLRTSTTVDLVTRMRLFLQMGGESPGEGAARRSKRR